MGLRLMVPPPSSGHHFDRFVGRAAAEPLDTPRELTRRGLDASVAKRTPRFGSGRQLQRAPSSHLGARCHLPLHRHPLPAPMTDFRPHGNAPQLPSGYASLGAMSATDLPAAGLATVRAAALEPDAILRTDAMSYGFNADDIQRERRSGEWVSLRPAYVSAAGWRTITRQRHIMMIDGDDAEDRRAGRAQSSVSRVCTRDHAVAEGLRAVRITVPGASIRSSASVAAHLSRASRRGRDHHRGRLPDHQRGTNSGRPRPISPFESAVVAADAALHRGLCSPDELADAARSRTAATWHAQGRADDHLR